MPRGKKNPGPAETGNDTNGTKAKARAGTTKTRPRRVPAEPVAETVVAVGYPVAGMQEQFTEIQRELAEIARQAREARTAVQSLRDEREQIGRELAELRQQVRAAQEQSLRETREGYSKVGQELTHTTARLSEAVKNAQTDLSEVVRQAREARREVEEYRRRSQEARREAAPEEAAPKSRRQRPARGEAAPAEKHNRLGVTVGNGVVVAELLPDTPAEEAGLTRGDVIEEVNGKGVVTAAQLRDAVQNAPADEDVTLTVFRAGELTEIKVRLAKGEEGDAANDDNGEGRNRLGVTVGPGVVVADVIPDTPAATAGLARGDVIDDLNGTSVRSGEQLREVIRDLPNDTEAVLRVTRAGEVREVRTRVNG